MRTPLQLIPGLCAANSVIHEYLCTLYLRFSILYITYTKPYACVESIAKNK